MHDAFVGHGDAAVVRYELAIKVLSPCDEESGWDGMSRVDEGSVVKTHECEVLVMADGMAKPNDPEHGYALKRVANMY